MPEERLARRDRGRRAEGHEPVDRASRLLSRAAAIAAGVAVASIGLAYVAAQAGVADATALADEVELPGTGRHLTSTVPEVSSPELVPTAVPMSVIVEPDPVVPDPIPPRTGGEAGAPEPRADERPTDLVVAGDRGATEGAADTPTDGDRGDDGWGDLREWWQAQSEDWDRAWREALSSAGDSDSRWSGRDRGRPGGR